MNWWKYDWINTRRSQWEDDLMLSYLPPFSPLRELQHAWRLDGAERSKNNHLKGCFRKTNNSGLCTTPPSVPRVWSNPSTKSDIPQLLSQFLYSLIYGKCKYRRNIWNNSSHLTHDYFSKVKVPVFTPTILLQYAVDVDVLGQKYCDFFLSPDLFLPIFSWSLTTQCSSAPESRGIPFRSHSKPWRTGQETINMGGNNYQWTNDGFECRLQAVPRSKQG